MSKEFKTNATYATIFSRFLKRGDEFVRIFITPKNGDSYGVYSAMSDAIKKSIIASDKVIEKAELEFFTCHSTSTTKINVENVYGYSFLALLKSLLNQIVGLKLVIYRKERKFIWIIASGSARKNLELGKKWISYNNYAEVLDKVLKCKASKNIKCSILGEEKKKLTVEEKVNEFEKIITAGNLDKTKYQKVSVTYIMCNVKDQMMTKTFGSITGEELKEKLKEIFSQNDIKFAYVSALTTKNKLLEWAIYY